MGVRGTMFFVSTPKFSKNVKVNTWMCVNEGSVAVYTKEDSKKFVLVKEGEGVVVNSPKLPEVKKYSWTKELNWKFEGKFKDVEDKTNIQNIKYDLDDFNYD